MKKIEEVKGKKDSPSGRQKGGRDAGSLEEGDGPLFGIAMHGDVWKRLQKKERKREEREGKDGKEGGEQAQPAKKRGGQDLFRQKMGPRRRKRQVNPLPPSEEEGGKDEEKKAEVEEEKADEKPAAKGKGKKEQAKQKAGGSDKDGDAEKPSPASPSSSPSSSSSPSLMDRFVALCHECQSVIACRLEPIEKADIVDLMRERTGQTCLAIGDGNNDQPMILRADIGVGIAGVEGTSAVSSSDFALSQFRFLPRLLLVHGRLNHRRISILICYMFYKTAFVVWALFMYGMYSQFSGQVFILDWAFQLHNVVYTALPILVFAVMDYDLSQETLARHPEVYKLTRYTPEHRSIAHALSCFTPSHPASLFFSYAEFLQWLLMSILHALLCFFVTVVTFARPSSPASDGQSFGLWELGLVMYTCICFTTNLHLIFFFSSWTWLHHLSMWGSLALYALAMAMFSSSTIFDIAGGSLYYSAYRLAALPSFYLTLGLAIGACLVLSMTWVESVRWLAGKQDAAWLEREKDERAKRLRGGKAGRDGGEDEEEQEEGGGSYRAFEEEDEKEGGRGGKQKGKKVKEKEDKAGGERKKKAAATNHYTGSLFSYTPNIRTLYD